MTRTQEAGLVVASADPLALVRFLLTAMVVALAWMDLEGQVPARDYTSHGSAMAISILPRILLDAMDHRVVSFLLPHALQQLLHIGPQIAPPFPLGFGEC